MKNKVVTIAVAVLSILFGSLVASPAHATSDWATSLAWSGLHVKTETGVFENWHREWVNNKDFSTPINYDSPSQHGLAWVRTDRNSFTATYNGGATQANKLLMFTFQGYNENGDAMNYTVAAPAPTVSASPSPSAYPQPAIKTIAGSQTYFAATTVTTDDNGFASVVITLKVKPVAFASIIVNVQTVVGQGTATVGTPKSGNVAVSYSAISGATVYQYSKDGGNTWIDAPASPFTLKATDVTQGVQIRGFSVVGPQVVTWQPAGWRPIVKLVGTTTGRQCDPYANIPSKYLCNGIDFKDQTFDWSVANRDWFQGSQAYDYAQAYAKSYSAGCLARVTVKVKVKGKYVSQTTCKTTSPNGLVALKFYAHDVWGTPIKSLPLSVTLQSGSITKWGRYPSSVKTDANGFATFSVQNLNTAAEVNAHVDVNPDPPHVKTRGVLGFVVSVTSNETDEVVDQMWFQLVSDITIPGGYPNSRNQIKYPAGSVDFPIVARGPHKLDPTTDYGDYWPDGGDKNPALTLDPTGTSLDDTIIAAISINSLKNLSRNLVYAPDVVITATNGGLSALATADQKAAGYVDFKDAARFKSTIKFGYNYYQDLVFMATQPGLTTWTVSIGKWSYSFSQSYVAPTP